VVILAVLATIAIPTFLQDITNSKSAVAAESAAAIARDAEGMNSSNPNPDGSVNSVTLSNLIAATGEASGSYTSTASGFQYDATNGTSACVVFTGTGANQQFTVTKGACAGGGGPTTTAPTTTTTAPTGPILASVAVPPAAYGVCSDGTDVWTVGGGTVTEVNASSLAVVNTVAVGSGSDALSCYGGTVWVADYSGGTVSEIDAATATVTHTYSSAGASSPSSIYVDATGVWVAGGDLVELDASTGAVLNDFPASGAFTAVAGNGTDVWASDLETGQITEIDESSATVVGSPWAATSSSFNSPNLTVSGTDVWVTDFFGNAVYEYSATGTLLHGPITSNEPSSVAVTGNDVWVTELGGADLAEINATTGAIIQTADTSSYGSPYAIDADSSHLWVAIEQGVLLQVAP
jgi:Tfp pilus assembly protein PilE